MCQRMVLVLHAIRKLKAQGDPCVWHQGLILLSKFRQNKSRPCRLCSEIFSQIIKSLSHLSRGFNSGTNASFTLLHSLKHIHSSNVKIKLVSRETLMPH